MLRLSVILLALLFGSAAVAEELGDDGLHKAPWMRDTFKDLAEDLAEASGEGKRLLLLFEQRGCVYCTRMHEEVFPDPDVTRTITDSYFVVQLNLYGNTEVIDFDGETLSEKAVARKWGILFTPSMMFMPESVPQGRSASEAAVAVMPGAFGRGTTLDLLTWVAQKRYLLDTDEDFQRYHARRIRERNDVSTD
ncbi:MAG: thioredoxin family protein [Alphaproteobacteria bacterium]|nr:thioredoxin family protein [Alphaproteobacteria bacterium]